MENFFILIISVTFLVILIMYFISKIVDKIINIIEITKNKRRLIKQGSGLVYNIETKKLEMNQPMNRKVSVINYIKDKINNFFKTTKIYSNEVINFRNEVLSTTSYLNDKNNLIKDKNNIKSDIHKSFNIKK